MGCMGAKESKQWRELLIKLQNGGTPQIWNSGPKCTKSNQTQIFSFNNLTVKVGIISTQTVLDALSEGSKKLPCF